MLCFVRRDVVFFCECGCCFAFLFLFVLFFLFFYVGCFVVVGFFVGFFALLLFLFCFFGGCYFSRKQIVSFHGLNASLMVKQVDVYRLIKP